MTLTRCIASCYMPSPFISSMANPLIPWRSWRCWCWELKKARRQIGWLRGWAMCHWQWKSNVSIPSLPKLIGWLWWYKTTRGYGESWLQLSWEVFNDLRWLMCWHGLRIRMMDYLMMPSGQWGSSQTVWSAVGVTPEKGVMLHFSKDTYSSVVPTRVSSN